MIKCVLCKRKSAMSLKITTSQGFVIKPFCIFHAEQLLESASE